MKLDRHLLPGPHPERRQSHEGAKIDFMIGPAREDLLEGDPRFEAGESSADTEMNAVSERQMSADHPLAIEGIR